MKYIFTLINICLLTIALYFCVTLVYKRIESQMLTGLDQSDTIAAATDFKNPSKKTVPPRDYYQPIIKRNLFKADTGEKKAEQKKTNHEITDTSTLEKTDLDLKLWGTITGLGTKSYAVIEDLKTRKQALYHQEDQIQGAVIKTILRQKIILSHNNRDQVLEMDIKSSNRRSTPGLSRKTETKSSDKITINRSKIDESINDINTLMKQVRIRPHFRNGKADGLLVYGIKPNSLFQEMGLKNGDILTGVDGKEIKSVDDALTLYESLKNKSDVNMQIKRRGTTKEINYHVQQ